MMATTQTNRSLQAPQDYNVLDMFIPDRCNETPCCPHEEYPAAYAEKTSIVGPGPLRGQPGALSLNDDTSYNGFDFLRQRLPEALTTAINRCVPGRSTAEWPGSDDSSFGSIALPCIADPNVPENGYHSMPTFSNPPTSPFHAPAAIQTSLPTSQPPQTYNHHQTVPSIQSTHPSPSNQPFHSAGAHPALPWQQSTGSLNHTVQMAPPTAYCGHSSTHPPLSGRYSEQPSGVASPDKPPRTARVHNELAMHSVRPIYDDPSLSAAHGMMPGFAPGFETCASGQPRMHQGGNDCVVGDESGCICGMQTPVGPPAAAPWDHLSPPPTSKCVAGGGDSGLRPAFSYPPDNQLHPYQHMPGQPTVSQQPHPYIHPYAHPHSQGQRYGRIADAYGMPPPYAPYWRGPSYRPMAPMGRPGAAWLPPGHPTAPAPTLGQPQAGRRPDIAVHSRTLDTYTPPYLPLPCPGTDPYTEYHPRAVYGRMTARLPPSSAPPLLPADRLLPRSASADYARVREQLPLRARMPLPYGTDSETVNATPTYDGAPSAAAAVPATVSSCSLAQPWGSFKRPRLAAHWSLVQPATPPTDISPPPTTPQHPQPPQPPLMAPTQLPQHTPITAMSAPETTAPATTGAPPSTLPTPLSGRMAFEARPHPTTWPADATACHNGTMQSMIGTSATSLIPGSNQEPYNHSDLDISFDELYLCMEGMEVNDPTATASGNGNTHTNPYLNGGCANGCDTDAMAHPPNPAHHHHHHQHHQHHHHHHQLVGLGGSSALSPSPTLLRRCAAEEEASGSSSRTPAPAPAATSALASAEAEAAPMPAGLKAEVETVDTADGQDAQQLQPTVKVQNEPAASSGAVAVPPALTAADTTTEDGHQSVTLATSGKGCAPGLLTVPSDVPPAPFSSPYSASGCSSITAAEVVGPAAPARTNYRRGPRGSAARRFHGNTSRQARASSAALLQQAERTEPLPEPVRVTVAGPSTAGRTGGGGGDGGAQQGYCRGSGSEGGSNDEQGQDDRDEGGEGAVVGAGGVVGVFHMLPYLEGAKCIEYGGEMVSRSAFERAGGSMMAKWYRSIKVLPDGMSLGKWLASNNLPILKGNPRRSKKVARSSEQRGDSDD